MGNHAAKHELVELPDGGSLVPTGLYAHDPATPPDFDQKLVKRLILEKKMSPFYQPAQEEAPGRTAECPICFLYYPEPLNHSRCCDQPICTECFLQIKHPQSGGPATCPFCVEVNYGITFNTMDKYVLQTGTSTMGLDTRKNSVRRKSIPKNAPNVVTTDMVRPNGRRQSGILTRYTEAARRLRSSSTNVSAPRASVRASTTFAERGYITAAQLETNWERLMIEQAIRQSILDEEERVRREEEEQQRTGGPPVQNASVSGQNLSTT